MAEEYFDDDFDSPDRIHEGSGDFVDKPGTYHVLIDAIDEYGGKKNDSLVTHFRVITGTNPDQAGKTLKDTNTKMSNKPFHRKKRYWLACCLGLTSVEEGKKVKARREAGDTDAKVEWSWADGIGRHMAIEVVGEADADTGKVYYKTPFPDNFMSIDEARRKGVPIDEAKLAVATGEDPFVGAAAASDGPSPADDPFA